MDIKPIKTDADYAKAFSVVIIKHIERLEFSTINQGVAHEVD